MPPKPACKLEKTEPAGVDALQAALEGHLEDEQASPMNLKLEPPDHDEQRQAEEKRLAHNARVRFNRQINSYLSSWCMIFSCLST